MSGPTGRASFSSPMLVGSRAPDHEVAASRHRATRDDALRLRLHLPGARAPLDLLDGVGVHPESRASAADVAAARGDGLRTLDADVLRVEVVERLPVLDAGVPKAFQVEDVEEA